MVVILLLIVLASSRSNTGDQDQGQEYEQEQESNRRQCVDCWIRDSQVSALSFFRVGKAGRSTRRGRRVPRYSDLSATIRVIRGYSV
jgi:hypothetical protein